MKIITADHVLPISSEPLINGAVAIDGAIIAAVGGREEIVDAYPNAEIEDFGEAAILPGFVNCHSHLELTAMRGALDDVEHDFRSWLLKINSLRSAMSDEDIVEAAVAGALEGAAAGVTCFGDIGRFGHAGVEALKRAGLRGIVFQETDFSPDNATADDDFARLGEKFEKLKAEETDLVKIGLSPHSPYTVGSRLFELIAQYAIIKPRAADDPRRGIGRRRRSALPRRRTFRGVRLAVRARMEQPVLYSDRIPRTPRRSLDAAAACPLRNRFRQRH